ncbi:ComEA family DNA-binding protein [Actinomadura harenae]|uniref:Helix-hairpin-helix domain-containing protein n=1 Tax=Actinomadura harenae TaxID=2483351 RepID=A0A3M2MDK6_9ACTN|nr:helix-hairpin-helix domain-containing protein [Actinomadura harenae]RMI47632.1 helix-hairpin-helix domain-containing protein [Actinomadura harenae]
MSPGSDPRSPDGRPPFGHRPVPSGGRPVPSGPPPKPLVPRGLSWAFVPFVTLGWGTPLSFLYASVKTRSAGLATGAAAYTSGIALSMYLWSLGDVFLFLVGSFVMTMVWIAGTANAFAVRRSVFPAGVPRDRMNEHAVQVARHRRVLREDARRLCVDDPALAHELRIGRPDLERTYDDGGLVDVNHAPAAVLAGLPGLSAELAGRIVAHRAEHGGFVSVEELAVDVDLPPVALPKLKEYALFLE